MQCNACDEANQPTCARCGIIDPKDMIVCEPCWGEYIHTGTGHLTAWAAAHRTYKTQEEAPIVNVINISDPDEVVAALNSVEGERAILNIMWKNCDSWKKAEVHDCGQPLCTWKGSSWCRD